MVLYRIRKAKSDPSEKFIAHLVQEYLGHTLNWIHTQIKYSQGYSHYVLTSKILNLKDYPVSRIFDIKQTGFPFNLIEKVSRRLGYLPIHYFLCYSKVIRNYRPVLLFAHFGWEGYFSLGLRRAYKIPLITRFYGYDVGILPRLALWQRRYHRLFTEGDLFIVEGQNMKRSLIAMGCQSNKIVVHHLGIELDKLEYRPRQSVPGKLRVLMAATFKEKKGYEYALTALKEVTLELKNLDISIRIIGDGPLRDKLHALARELELSELIEWCGYKPPVFFYQALYEADLFLSPSVTASDGDTEGGAPVALIEAGASGLPVISTIHADIPEVVINGQTGLLVPERDIKQIAQAIIHMAKDSNMRFVFGENARRHIETNFNAITQGIALSDIYNSVIRRTLS